MRTFNVDSYKDDITFIRTQINEELSTILLPQIERIVKLLIKTGVMGVASFYLQGEVLEPVFNNAEVKYVNEKS